MTRPGEPIGYSAGYSKPLVIYFLQMLTGDRVRVYPHGSPDQAAEAEIILISQDRLSILLSFCRRTPFVTGVLVFYPAHGGVMVVSRTEMESKPWWGPWIELFGGGHYEIEEIQK